MIAKATTTEIDSIEDLTIFSLDHSHEGLESLINGSRQCGIDLRKNSEQGMQTLLPLVNALHDFDSFENDLCSLFQIERKEIIDTNGNLDSITKAFRGDLKAIEEMLEKQDFSGLALLLFAKLPSTLERFQALLPSLRRYIDEKYIQTEAKHA